MDVLSRLAAGHLFVLCQALDLRATQYQFLEASRPELQSATEEIIASILKPRKAQESFTQLSGPSDRNLEQAVTTDTEQRFTCVVPSLEPVVLQLTLLPGTVSRRSEGGLSTVRN